MLGTTLSDPDWEDAVTTGKLTKREIASLRERLLSDRRSLLTQASALEETVVVGAWDGGGYDDGSADGGTATSERERAQSLATNARRILVQVDDALRRLDAGTYGLCEACGAPIEAARLEALPYATLCLTDKQLAERLG